MAETLVDRLSIGSNVSPSITGVGVSGHFAGLEVLVELGAGSTVHVFTAKSRHEGMFVGGWIDRSCEWIVCELEGSRDKCEHGLSADKRCSGFYVKMHVHDQDKAVLNVLMCSTFLGSQELPSTTQLSGVMDCPRRILLAQTKENYLPKHFG